jgi:hypothetical protein
MSFKSVMEHFGHDLKVGLEHLFPYLLTTGQVAVDMFFPGVSALYKQTVASVITAEQAAVAVKDAGGSMTGQQKAAAVFGLMGPIIKQGLIVAGKEGSDAEVQKYIDSVVLILNTAPAPPTGN